MGTSNFVTLSLMEKHDQYVINKLIFKQTSIIVYVKVFLDALF